MRRQVLLDTGPLVALLKYQDRFHDWVTTELAMIESPLLTCEAVLSEACFLFTKYLRWSGSSYFFGQCWNDPDTLCLNEEAGIVGELITRYQSVPMSLADACLVRMAEQYSESFLLTLDSDFNIYRKNTKQIISVIMPQSQ